MVDVCSVYEICVDGTRKYVGISSNPRKRWNAHKWSVGKSKHKIHKKMAEVGVDKCCFNVLAQDLPRTQAEELEKQLIEKDRDSLWNSCRGGGGMKPGLDHAREAMSAAWTEERRESLRRKWQDPDWRASRLAAFKKHADSDPEYYSKRAANTRIWANSEDGKEVRSTLGKVAWADAPRRATRLKSIAKLSQEDVINIRWLAGMGSDRYQLCQRFNVSASVICNVHARKTWKHVN